MSINVYELQHYRLPTKTRPHAPPSPHLSCKLSNHSEIDSASTFIFVFIYCAFIRPYSQTVRSRNNSERGCTL